MTAESITSLGPPSREWLAIYNRELAGFDERERARKAEVWAATEAVRRDALARIAFLAYMEGVPVPTQDAFWNSMEAYRDRWRRVADALEDALLYDTDR